MRPAPTRVDRNSFGATDKLRPDRRSVEFLGLVVFKPAGFIGFHTVTNTRDAAFGGSPFLGPRFLISVDLFQIRFDC
jgi:hypothetical protein